MDQECDARRQELWWATHGSVWVAAEPGSLPPTQDEFVLRGGGAGKWSWSHARRILTGGVRGAVGSASNCLQSFFLVENIHPCSEFASLHIGSSSGIGLLQMLEGLFNKQTPVPRGTSAHAGEMEGSED